MKNRLTEINYLIYYLKHGLDESLKFFYIRKPVTLKFMNTRVLK